MALIKPNLAEIKASSGDIQIQWERVGTEFKGRSYVMNIWGDSDTGKTKLSLTSRGPIAYVHNNDKVGFVLEEEVLNTAKEIQKIPFRSGFLGSTDEVQNQASNELAFVLAHIKDAYKWAGTIIIDHETALWDLFQLAQLGTLTRADLDKETARKGQLIYSQINAHWLNTIMDVRDNGKINLILVSKTKNERVTITNERGKLESIETSKIVPKQQKSTFAICDLVLHTWVADGNSYMVTIDKPWNNGPWRGKTIPSMPLSEIVGLITKTDAKEWE